MTDTARVILMVVALSWGLAGLCACKDSSGTAGKVTRDRSAEKTTEKGQWPYLQDTQKGEVAANLLTKNFVVVFDGSGSMAEHKCAEGRSKSEVSKEAILEWSESVPQGSQVGLISFHRGGWTEIPLRSYDREVFRKVIGAIQPGGTTPLAQAMGRADKMLLREARKQLGYGEYTIVVVTDGIADSPQDLVKTVNSILARTPVVIHTIGFCIGSKHSLNQPGRTYYRTANDPAALRQGLKEVLAEADTFDPADFGR